MKTIKKEPKIYADQAGRIEGTYNGYKLDKKAYVKWDAILHTLIFEKKNPFTKRMIKDMGKELAQDVLEIISDMTTNPELKKLETDLKNEYLII